MEDSAILVDENKKTSSTQKKNITIVYVHGFRGGKNTFWDFPALLKKSLETYNIEINNKVYTILKISNINIIEQIYM